MVRRPQRIPRVGADKSPGGGHDPVPQFKATAKLDEFLSQLPN